MNDFNDRARARDVSLMLRGMLTEVRNAPKDARDFLVFDKRDDWTALGLGDDHLAAADLTDDAMLDREIADCTTCLHALGHDDEDAVAVTAQASEPRPFGEGYTTLYPRAYDPQRSSGMNAQATQPMIDAVNANRRLVAPNGSGGEPVVVGVPDGAGGFKMVRPRVRTHSTATADTATVIVPADAEFLSHGHLEGANGFVDAPTANRGLGDASTLARQNPIPNFTVFDRQTGWHDLENGRLRFTYPTGSMAPAQVLELQRNLDGEQELLYRKD